MITKMQKANAETIVELATTFGSLYFNDSQTVEQVLNLSIPCARLIVAGVVTGVTDTNDGVNDNAVAEMQEYCRLAVAHTAAKYGEGWWNGKASALL